MSNERDQIDPERRYPAEGLLRVEENALRVLACLPASRLERTRDAIQIDFGDEDEGVTVLVTAETIELRLPTVEWTCGAYGPAGSSRRWKRIRPEAASDEELRDLVHQAMEARRAEFRPCKYCGQLFPPEHRTGKACYDCASGYEGVVY
ncbi:MAG: hypothetical protein M0000_09990 [Actinomycetota bacterium]|nr:hypothetical protein [Actinomycetota bacterium]